MTVIFRDFTTYLRSFSLGRVLTPVWSFLNQLIPLYAWNVVYGVPIEILDDKGSDISDFFKDVKSCARHNLLTSDYPELIPDRISRYFMQVRYGSTYSKVKHIRVYSYFADAIFFPNGSLWRDA